MKIDKIGKLTVFESSSNITNESLKKLSSYLKCSVKKMIIVNRKDNEIEGPRELYRELNTEVNSVTNSQDLFYLADIIIVRDQVNFSVGYSVTDSPIVVVIDNKNKLCAIANCTLLNINKGIHQKMIDILIKEYGSNKKDLRIHITSHISPKRFIVKRLPKEIEDNKDMWKDYINEMGEKHRIYLRNKLIDDMRSKGIYSNISISFTSNATHPEKFLSIPLDGIQEKPGEEYVGVIWNRAKIKEKNM